MEEERYTVSQAEKITGIRGHVLRYWEDELGLRIGRNAMGYRCYTRYDIQLFLNIKELKTRGLQLKAIKELVPRISRYGPGAPASKIKLLETEKTSEDPPLRAAQAEEAAAAKEEREETDEAYDARMEEFQRILEKLIAEGLKKPTHEDRRSCSLDEAIRLRQQDRKLAAAAREKKSKRGISLFHKKKTV